MIRRFIAVLLCAAHITASAIKTADTIVKKSKSTSNTHLQPKHTYLRHERERGLFGTFLHTPNARLAQMIAHLVAEKNKASLAQAGS